AIQFGDSAHSIAIISSIGVFFRTLAVGGVFVYRSIIVAPSNSPKFIARTQFPLARSDSVLGPKGCLTGIGFADA
ncbi:MAG TPA: hypothetical protein VMZ02_04335, partial [Candidatus Limnocylindrales bacterium]|nr:hypothetical protein [Candidatus Limnocylindrales bacterium]